MLRPSCVLSSLDLVGSVLELKGTASIAWLGPAEVTPVLRQREGAHEIVCAPAQHEGGRFTARIDLSGSGEQAPVGFGHWDVWLRLTAHGFEREIRPGSEREESLGTRPHRAIVFRDEHHAAIADAHFTPFNNITVRVADASRHLTSMVTTTSVSWSEPDPATLVIVGVASIAGLPADALAISLSCQQAEFRTPAALDADGAFTAHVELPTIAAGRPVPDGRWSVNLCLDVADLAGTTPVRWRDEVPAKRWRRGLGLARAKLSHTEKGSLRLTIAAVDMLGAVARRVGI